MKGLGKWRNAALPEDVNAADAPDAAHQLVRARFGSSRAILAVVVRHDDRGCLARRFEDGRYEKWDLLRTE
jgi:hypothetical protein